MDFLAPVQTPRQAGADPQGAAGYPPRRVPLLGTLVDAITFRETLDRIEDIVRSRRPTQHVVLNAAKVVAVHDDPTLKRIIEGCGLINADGASVVWASRLLGVPVPERVTGIDLMHALLERAGQRGWRVYFLGAHREVVEQTVFRIQESFPGLVVAGWRDGYFSEEENPGVVHAIAESGADVLLVALPSPRKERWIQKHLLDLGVPFCMGVGGSFDVLAGVVKRAPGWMQLLGLEWLFRLLQEPRRLWKRYLVTNSRFLVLVLSEFWNGRKGDRKRKDPEL